VQLPRAFTAFGEGEELLDVEAFLGRLGHAATLDEGRMRRHPALSPPLDRLRARAQHRFALRAPARHWRQTFQDQLRVGDGLASDLI